jgi:four helix bundle protein
MERTNFEKLQVYKLSEKLSDHIWRIVVRWEFLPKDTVGRQLIRAADSIGANIAEGSGRGTDPDLRRFLRIARGSLYETQHWLRRAYKRKLLTEKEVNDLLPIIQELTPKLNAYLRSIGTLKTKRRAPDPR